MFPRPQGRALLAALALACLPAAGRAGTASNQLCTAAGRGAGCIGTPQAPSGSDAPAPQVNPAAASAVSGVVGGVIGSALGNALATPTNSPRYEHKEVKPVVGDDDIPAKTDVDDAQDVIRQFAQPKVHPPASDWQVDATIAELQPLVNHPRSKIEPKLAKCESGCGCPNKKGRIVCTPNCTGTCYLLGGKDADPDGAGIDCSGLIAQENPCFWYKNCGKGKDDPELNCRKKDGTACDGGGAEQELTMLRQKDLDDKDKATALNAGDVVFFTEGKPDIGHVVQVTSDPVCNENGCMMSIIQAPHSGVPVEEAVFIIDKNGRTSKILPDPKGGWIVESTNLVMKAGGTPPPGPKTGGGKTE